MAKLDITAAQIQSTTNMITSTSAASEWNTDTKYPSAKAVLGREYPIESVLITSSNYAVTDPKHPNNSIGGTWALFDKEYKTTAVTEVPWESSKATLTGFAIRSNHMIQLTTKLTTNTVISTAKGELLLGYISSAEIGGAPGAPLSLGYTADYSFTYAVYTNGTTTESCLIRYSLGGAGSISISEILNTDKQLPEGATIYLNTSVPMSYNSMADACCDKFYWKRTA